MRERGLFFLDSKTSPESVAAEIASRLQVPFAERSVFLDHDPEPAAVAREMRSSIVGVDTPGARRLRLFATGINAISPWSRRSGRQIQSPP